MSEESKSHYDDACRLFLEKRFNEALREFERAIELDPKFALPWNGRGSGLAALGRHEEALESFERAIELDFTRAHPWNGKGGILSIRGRYEEAIESFERAIELDPTLALPWNGKGNALLELGRDKEALEAFERAISLDPSFANPWERKGAVLHRLGYNDEALKAVKQSIELNPNLAGAWNGKACLLLELGLREEALASYERAIELDSTAFESWEGQGIVLDTLGQHEQAIYSFEQALVRKSTAIGSLNGKGVALLFCGRFVEALESFELAIQLDPKIANPWAGRGNALLGLGRSDEAFASFDRAIELDSHLAEPWGGKGNIFLARGEPRRALPCYFRFYKLVKRQNFYSVLPTFIGLFESAFFSPLFIYAILFEDYPELLTYSIWRNLATEVEGQCEEVLDLIAYLNTKELLTDDIEREKLKGLVYYYMGHPLRAYDSFNTVDNLDDTDLMGQYYYIQSLNGFEEDQRGELQGFVYQQTSRICDSRRITSSQQWYYAGLIFCQQNDCDSALRAFNNVQEDSAIHLAALYMTFLCSHKKGNYRRENELLELILWEELKLSDEGRTGFLGATSFGDIDLSTSDWQLPFYKFANLMEISEALFLFYRVAEENGVGHGTTFQSLRNKVDRHQVSEASAIAAWRLHEKSKVVIERARTEMKSREVERQRNRLNVVFTNNIPFDKESMPSKRIEEAVSRKIDEYGKGVKDKEHDMLLLISYLFNEGKLDSGATILLYFYVKMKVEMVDKGTFTKEFVNATFRGALTTGSTILVAGLCDPVRVLVGALGAGFFALFVRYFQEKCLFTSKGEELHYFPFKHKFIEFIAIERDRLGDMFDEKYPLNVFKNVVEKENDDRVPSIARLT